MVSGRQSSCGEHRYRRGVSQDYSCTQALPVSDAGRAAVCGRHSLERASMCLGHQGAVPRTDGAACRGFADSTDLWGGGDGCMESRRVLQGTAAGSGRHIVQFARHRISSVRAGPERPPRVSLTKEIASASWDTKLHPANLCAKHVFNAILILRSALRYLERHRTTARSGRILALQLGFRKKYETVSVLSRLVCCGRAATGGA